MKKITKVELGDKDFFLYDDGSHATLDDYVSYLELSNKRQAKKLKRVESKLADMDVTISNEINPDIISDAIQVRLADYMNDIGKLKDDAERFRALMNRSKLQSCHVSCGREIFTKIVVSSEFERAALSKVGDSLSMDDVVSLIDSVREHGDKYPRPTPPKNKTLNT